MRLVALLVASVAITAGAMPAQSQWGAPRHFTGPVTAPQVAYVVELMGLNPVGRATRRGGVFVQRATDAYGKPMRVAVNAASGTVVSVRPAEMAAARPYEAVDAPYWQRPYPVYGTVPPPDQDGFEQPRYAPAPRAATPTLPPLPKERAAKVTPETPTKIPVPRKRPDAAEAATKSTPGAVSPLPEPPPANTPATPDKPATPATPPINPLE